MMVGPYWRPHDGHLLPSGLSSTPCPVGKRFVLPVGGRGGGGRLSPMPALPARNRSVFQRLDRQPGNRRAGAAWLIAEEGALDQEGATVERVAQRLGVGSRQLTRLFARYLQASPAKVARTARVQRAKRLLDETSLPMSEIAMRAGFGSLRRFNSVFVEVYGRPPTKIRRTRGAAGRRRGEALDLSAV